MRGFFAGSLLESGKAPTSLIPKCSACGLHKHCTSPKHKYYGQGKRRVLILDESPSLSEDAKGKLFSDDGGLYLRECLEDIGVDLEKDCWYSTAIGCYVSDSKLWKKAPAYCRPRVLEMIKDLQPTTVILLGSASVSSYIGHVWKANPGPLSKWVGWNIPCQFPNQWICPTYNPSLIQGKKDQIPRLLFKQHIAQAFKNKDVPWQEIEDIQRQIEVILDADKATRIIEEMERRGGVIAYDLENNCLKPEYKGGEIVCASLCWHGKRTIAFPWTGAVIPAMKKLLHSKRCYFIAANLKHENRWTMDAYGRGVRNWYIDTMVAAHILDNRPGICSLKFQAFVNLGAESYDDHIKQYLQATDGGHLNRVREEIDLHQLLLYCGTDTLLEYRLGMKQRRKLNIAAENTYT